MSWEASKGCLGAESHPLLRGKDCTLPRNIRHGTLFLLRHLELRLPYQIIRPSVDTSFLTLFVLRHLGLRLPYQLIRPSATYLLFELSG